MQAVNEVNPDLFSRDDKLRVIYGTTHADFKGVAGDVWPANDRGKPTILTNENGVTCLTLLQDLTDAQVNEKFALAQRRLTSKLLASLYPVKGSMPSLVTSYLYQLREREVARLAEKAEVFVEDLAGLDRGAMLLAVISLYEKCTREAKVVFLNHAHHCVRSAAIMAQAEQDR